MQVVLAGINNLRDIPDSLRRLADGIDEGRINSVHVIVVSETSDGKVEMFGYGDVGDTKAEVGLLQMAVLEMATM